MEIITAGRGEGKTRTLIKMAAEGDGYIVCPTAKDQHRIFHELAKANGDDIRFPITWGEILKGPAGFHAPGIKEFYFDDLDRMLAAIARGVSIRAVTMTEDKKGSYGSSAERR